MSKMLIETLVSLLKQLSSSHVMLLYEGHQQHIASIIEMEMLSIENRKFFLNKHEIKVGTSVDMTVKSLYIEAVLRNKHQIVFLLLCNLHLTEDILTVTNDMGFDTFNTVWITRKGQFPKHTRKLYHLGFSHVNGYQLIDGIQQKDHVSTTCSIRDIVPER